jgi:hypothetical protein
VSKTRAEFAQCRLIDENETRKLGLSGLDQSFLKRTVYDVDPAYFEKFKD